MKSHCAWHEPYPGTPDDPATSGICRKCELQSLANDGEATPAEYEELYQLLEPRAFAWSRIDPIRIAWSGLQKLGAWLISDEGSAAVTALTLSAAVMVGLPALADWVARGFEVVGR